jgi:predicted negative regulator of RcsB-dependent stress response
MEKTLKAHAATVSPAQLRQFIALNPHYYRAYEEAGDICHQQGIDAQARRYWSTALRMDLPKQMDRDRITRKLKKTE